MATQNEKALRDIELFFDGAIKKAKSTFKRSAKRLAEDMIDLTPTYFAYEPTSGNMKSNWRVSQNTPDETYDSESADYTGQETKSAIRSEIQSMKIKPDDIVYLSNTGPQEKLHALEFGGYPNPPRLGSYNKRRGEYEIRSAGGFSRQAPAGIVGISALRWQDIVEEESQKNEP